MSAQDFEAWSQQDNYQESDRQAEVFTEKKPVPDCELTSANDTDTSTRETRKTRRCLSKRDFIQTLECAYRDKGGIVFVANVESLEGIDPAFLRPGRFDRVIHVGKATHAMAEQLFMQFYSKLAGDSAAPYHGTDVRSCSKSWASGIVDGAFSLADLVGMLSMHRFDPEGAARAMPSWLRDKKGAEVKSEVIAERSTSDCTTIVLDCKRVWSRN